MGAAVSADGGGRSSGRGRQRTRRLGLRLTEAEFESWRREAERDGRTLGGWVRWAVTKELERQKREAEEDACASR